MTLVAVNISTLTAWQETPVLLFLKIHPARPRDELHGQTLWHDFPRVIHVATGYFAHSEPQ
jgi:hypothetical protein